MDHSLHLRVQIVSIPNVCMIAKRVFSGVG